MPEDKPKIAIILNSASPYTSALFRALAEEENLEIKVFYCSEPGSNRPENWRKERKGYDSEILSGIHFYWRGMHRDPISVNLGIVFAVARFDPDHVIIGGYSNLTSILAYLYCIVSGVPYVLWVDGVGSKQHPRLVNWIIDAIVNRSRSQIAGCERAEIFFLKHGKHRSTITHVPCVTDLRLFRSAVRSFRTGSQLQQQDDRRSILFVGRLVPEKGVLDLIRAFSLVKQEYTKTRLTIIGKGPLKGRMNDLIKELALRDVEHHEYLDDTQLARAYASADVFVLPSHSEPFGIVAVEAFVSNLTVVLSDNCGCISVMPRSDWLITTPPNDVKALGAAIKKALDTHHTETDNRVHNQEIESVVDMNSYPRLAARITRILESETDTAN